ncbi:aromatic amino acid lyase, partial [Escherichia coli]|nr:aromatic amino acid lyase [Escherichia coli]
MLNRGVHPVFPPKGSLGASGDLAPLAHFACVLIGEGQARYEGKVLSGGDALRAAGLK